MNSKCGHASWTGLQSKICLFGDHLSSGLLAWIALLLTQNTFESVSQNMQTTCFLWVLMVLGWMLRKVCLLSRGFIWSTEPFRYQRIWYCEYSFSSDKYAIYYPRGALCEKSKLEVVHRVEIGHLWRRTTRHAKYVYWKWCSSLSHYFWWSTTN